MHKKEITTAKTARYFILGEPNAEVDEVWIVCHGYAQLANYFLKKFECIQKPNRLIIAPEGLHRFYWNGFSGRVVASWMTKEDRLDDIKDYNQFLDNVVEDIKSITEKEFELNVLGFSQGAATVCRWISHTRNKINKAILWGSVFPEDINYLSKKRSLIR